MKVSVVIATRGDRPAALERCLNGLEAGSVHPDEVIVVDQGGGESPAERPFPVEIVPQAARGLSRGRNVGIRHAAVADVVAVTDDDCVPTSAWLEASLAALAADSSLAAVCGAVEPLPDPTGELVPVSSRRDGRARTASRSLEPWRLGTGGNVVARRDWLVRIGGYDERLGAGSPGLAGEDVDLVHRLLRAGGPVRYEPAAAVLHEQKRPEERRRRRYEYGFGVGAACGLWLRVRDATSLGVLAAWIALRLRLLVGAAVAGRWKAVADEVRVLAGTAAGVGYGLAARSEEA
jgi:GT2 family glycosyltransferase